MNRPDTPSTTGQPPLATVHRPPSTINRNALRLIVEPIAIAIVLAMVARSVFHMYTIPSASMAPTLQIGDHIIVTPYRVPFLADRPERGDVIVFHSPLNPEELLVKRVVAVPGDLLDTRGGRVRIGAHPR